MISSSMYCRARSLTKPFVLRQCSTTKTYKFTISQPDLDTVKATLPAVGEAGTSFTKHFYSRMFKAHPELLNVFNQTNQSLGGQPKKLLKTVAFAAQAAIETRELPGGAIESICHKHAALLVTPEQYGVVGEHLLGTIQDLLTEDANVTHAWGALYGDITGAFIGREKELADEVAAKPGGWRGRRTFTLTNKEKLSDTITRFQFTPVDGGKLPKFNAGQYTTIWAPVNKVKGPFDIYTEQPRHYTLAMPRKVPDHPEYDEHSNAFAISVKKQGLVSNILHESPVGSTFDLSPPFGCFDLSGVEQLWLAGQDAPVVFLSGGVGMTPVLAMLENIYVSRPATWLHAAENGAVHAYRDRLREIAAVRSGELQRRVWYNDPLPEDGEVGAGDGDKSSSQFNMAKYHYKGHMNLPEVEQDSHILHLDNKSTQYYMCGPPGFMEDQKQALVDLGVDVNRIHSEAFG